MRASPQAHHRLAERRVVWLAQRETKRQRLRRALAHQRLGLPPPAGAADLEVERGDVPAPGTAAHRDAFDAALGRVAGGAAAAPVSEPRGAAGGGHAAARDDDDDASGTDASAAGTGSADEEGARSRAASEHDMAAAPPADFVKRESAAERLQRQSAAAAAARAELRLAGVEPGADPGGDHGSTAECAGAGARSGGDGGRAAGSGGDAAPASTGLVPAAQPARVVHLKACTHSVVPATSRHYPNSPVHACLSQSSCRFCRRCSVARSVGHACSLSCSGRTNFTEVSHAVEDPHQHSQH